MPGIASSLGLREEDHHWTGIINPSSNAVTQFQLAIYRAFASIYLLWSVLFTIIYWDQWDDYMKAATNWAALFMLFSFLFLMAITYIESKDNAITLSYPAGLLRVAHITYEVALPTAFTVVTLYWVVVFDPDGSNTGWDMVSRVQNHACTAFLLLVDFILCNVVVNKRHSFFPMLVLGLYLIVNYLYTTHVEAVYNALTWEDSGSVVIVAQAFVGQIFFFASFWGFSKWRNPAAGRGSSQEGRKPSGTQENVV